MDINNFIQSLGIFYLSTNQIIMIVVGLIILFLAIKKKFEPLLLLPIGFGAILSNIPEIGLALSPIEQLLMKQNSIRSHSWNLFSLTMI